jgi:hypothetical protein
MKALEISQIQNAHSTMYALFFSKFKPWQKLVILINLSLVAYCTIGFSQIPLGVAAAEKFIVILVVSTGTIILIEYFLIDVARLIYNRNISKWHYSIFKEEQLNYLLKKSCFLQTEEPARIRYYHQYFKEISLNESVSVNKLFAWVFTGFCTVVGFALKYFSSEFPFELKLQAFVIGIVMILLVVALLVMLYHPVKEFLNSKSIKSREISEMLEELLEKKEGANKHEK